MSHPSFKVNEHFVASATASREQFVDAQDQANVKEAFHDQMPKAFAIDQLAQSNFLKVAEQIGADFKNIGVSTDGIERKGGMSDLVAGRERNAAADLPAGHSRA